MSLWGNFFLSWNRGDVVKMSPEQQAKALEFDRENWRRWAAKEITTDEACANLDKYMADLRRAYRGENAMTGLEEGSYPRPVDEGKTG